MLGIKNRVKGCVEFISEEFIFENIQKIRFWRPFSGLAHSKNEEKVGFVHIEESFDKIFNININNRPYRKGFRGSGVFYDKGYATHTKLQ